MLRHIAIALSGLCMTGAVGAADLPDPLAAGWKGEPVCEKLHEDEPLRILRCSFPPNSIPSLSVPACHEALHH
jgi:hypothetical protein